MLEIWFQSLCIGAVGAGVSLGILRWTYGVMPWNGRAAQRERCRERAALAEIATMPVHADPATAMLTEAEYAKGLARQALAPDAVRRQWLEQHGQLTMDEYIGSNMPRLEVPSSKHARREERPPGGESYGGND